jgi:hypothetical protein
MFFFLRKWQQTKNGWLPMEGRSPLAWQVRVFSKKG